MTEYEEMETAVMEHKLREIIEKQNKDMDAGSIWSADMLKDNMRVLEDPAMLRKAAKKLSDLFWTNTTVSNCMDEAADLAIAETVVENPEPTVKSFAIVRDGNVIELTEDEQKAFRSRLIHDEILSFVPDWVNEIADSLDAGMEREEDSALLEKMDGKGMELLASAFASPLIDNLIHVFNDDESLIFLSLLDRVFRPVAKKIFLEEDR